MATYEGIVKIKGAVGDLVFYTLNGKNVVRKKSGFNKNSFDKNPNYEKVRQNSSEFGHCSKIGKLIRTHLAEFINNCGDKLLYQKFAKIMTEIKDLDTVSGRGQRSIKNGITTEKGKSILRKFQFGEIPNINAVATVVPGLFGTSLQFSKAINNVEIFFVIMKIDYDKVSLELNESKLLVKEKTTEIPLEDSLFLDDQQLIFVAIKKSDKFTHIGFI